MILLIKLVGIAAAFYFLMNRLLTRLDDGYWFRPPTRHKFKPPGQQHNKSQQEHKESTETPKGTE
jgi:hypothetical protein